MIGPATFASCATTSLVLKEAPAAGHRRYERYGASASVDVRIPFKAAKEALIDAFERKYLPALLDAAGGNVSKAARQGGIDRMHVYRLLQKHGLRPGAGSSSSD
jgi:transcriptional regulator of acetoin/glycerol metabolism